TFTPNADWHGTISFQWSGSDGLDYATFPAFASLTLTPVQDPPTVSDFNKTGQEDLTIHFVQADFTNAFSDADGDTLTMVQITQLSADGVLKLGGTAVSLNQSIPIANIASLTFQPNSNWNGSTSLLWTAQDGIDYATSPASLDIIITPAQDAPTLTDFNKTGQINQTMTFTQTDFIDAFADADGDPLIDIKITQLPTNGTLKL
ncbi:MAG: hypothetical protein GY943_22375, partial [Chloroflexi bacterium]|nr:hypothetical protein [Chloroflexota bacterium]